MACSPPYGQLIGTRGCREKGGVVMKLRRIKRTHHTPKSHSEFTDVSFELGVGFDRLLKALARVIEKYFGSLYMIRLQNMVL